MKSLTSSLKSISKRLKLSKLERVTKPKKRLLYRTIQTIKKHPNQEQVIPYLFDIDQESHDKLLREILNKLKSLVDEKYSLAYKTEEANGIKDLFWHLYRISDGKGKEIQEALSLLFIYRPNIARRSLKEILIYKLNKRRDNLRKIKKFKNKP